jgi:signal transduction histidine kinase
VPSLPGARTSCALLTVLTILLAWPSPPPALPILVRPAYFALLFWFFRMTGRRSDQLRGQAMRLVCVGFLVLWLSSTTSTVIHFASLERRHAAFEYLRLACDQGALFLLGTTLISYGLMLWIPQVLESHRRLGFDVERQSGELRVAETTRSQLEHGLVEADRRAILGELAASIAHDLRNPLSIVKATAESLCRKPRSRAEIAEHTDVIQRNIDKADRTIASLIDLGRPRANAPAPLAAREAFQEILELVQIEGRRRRIHFAIAISQKQPEPRLYVDRALLAQALLNLLLNAVQASPPGSTITLRARSRARHGTTVLAIEDHGPGLQAAIRERLFTPFFTTKPHGTGLGLLSCRRIATELNGQLGLFPRHRGGARAIMLLPAMAPDTQGSRDQADELPRSAWETSSC